MLTSAEPRPAYVSSDALRGVYDARRAAALSGVPKRTLHYWAEKGHYRPSITPEPRTRFWSWYDLLALRAIDWLRRPHDHEGQPLQGVRFGDILEALSTLDQMGRPRSDLHQLVVRTRSGKLLFEVGGWTFTATLAQQVSMPDLLEVVRPYKLGPDLLHPRPLLRIIPGKLSGEPHVAGTRVSSQALYALDQDGYSVPQIQTMFPSVSAEALQQAIGLECSLAAAAA